MKRIELSWVKIGRFFLLLTAVVTVAALSFFAYKHLLAKKGPGVELEESLITCFVDGEEIKATKEACLKLSIKKEPIKVEDSEENMKEDVKEETTVYTPVTNTPPYTPPNNYDCRFPSGRIEKTANEQECDALKMEKLVPVEVYGMYIYCEKNSVDAIKELEKKCLDDGGDGDICDNSDCLMCTHCDMTGCHDILAECDN